MLTLRDAVFGSPWKYRNMSRDDRRKGRAMGGRKTIRNDGPGAASIGGARLIDIPTLNFERHAPLSFLEQNNHLPFEIKRVFYITDWQTGETRGVHAHKRQQQFLVPLKGAFSVSVDDGAAATVFALDRADRGLLVPAMNWTSITNHGSGNILLVIASDLYDEADYIRDYGAFQAQLKLP
jgi:hypothetical protein